MAMRDPHWLCCFGVRVLALLIFAGDEAAAQATSLGFVDRVRYESDGQMSG